MALRRDRDGALRRDRDGALRRDRGGALRRDRGGALRRDRARCGARTGERGAGGREGCGGRCDWWLQAGVPL